MFGAVDGNRTRLNWIDNPVPSQRTTTACMVCAAGFEPATPHFQGENSDLTELNTDKIGSPDTVRTCDQQINSLLLYRLSY